MIRPLASLALALSLATSAVAQPAEPPVRLAPPQALFREAVTLRQFVRGTLRFILLHEAGHGLMDLYDLPVLGREEDAADRFAVFWLTVTPEGEDGLDAIGAMEWWVASAKQSDMTREDLPWWDEHGIDEQRAFGIACLLYGASPDDYGALAGRMGIPPKRRRGCIGETQQNRASWTKVLKGEVRDARSLPFLVPMTYQTPSAGTAEAAQVLKDMRVMEETRGILNQFRASRKSVMITMVARDCNTSNASWNPNKHELTMCYELVNEVMAVGYAAGFR